MIDVLLIEDHEMVREGTARLLEGASGIRIVGATGTGKEGLSIAREKNPHVVILDFQLPDTNGLEVTRKLLRMNPEVKVLIVTAMKSEIMSLRLLEAGASGYLSKESGYSELEKAIRSVHHGQRYLSADMAHKLALHNTSLDAKNPFESLSNREMELALLLANGMNVEEIAKQLFIAKKTVHSYRYRIFEKLNIKSDLELLRMALKSGVIALDQAN